MLLLQDRLRNGGTERQTLLLARQFQAAGHQICILTFRPGGDLWATAFGVPHRSLQARDWGLDWHAPGLSREVRSESPDVLMAMGRMANCRLGGASRRPRSPALAIGTFRTGKSLPWLYRRSLRAADAVIANSSDAGRTLLERYRLPRNKVSVIRNGLSFGPPAPRIRRGGPVVFINVAMFRPEKGQANLLRLMAALPRISAWELWLAGDGPERAACERLARETGLGDRVKFLGFQPDPTPLYAQADVAVHASTSEALSNFLIEAQAYGLPVVACEAQGNSECVLPGETGWIVPPRDAAAFAAAVVPLMAMSDGDRRTLSARAAAFVREEFDPQRQAQAYLTLFERLLAEKKNARGVPPLLPG